MTAKTIIEHAKEELNVIYKPACLSPKSRAETWYAQAFEVITFASSLLWSNGYYKESQEVKELWENKWKAKFTKLLH